VRKTLPRNNDLVCRHGMSREDGAAGHIGVMEDELGIG
jgi:hypothetical protein